MIYQINISHKHDELTNLLNNFLYNVGLKFGTTLVILFRHKNHSRGIMCILTRKKERKDIGFKNLKAFQAIDVTQNPSFGKRDVLMFIYLFLKRGW